ncbi:hypothetical protein BGZ99_005612 [Dissophora globulifera]|uniref:Proteasome inhibitor PI31 subunit n=1 Tax=Dissophora globulifera TaxID=979702 RepID=A0A9P6UTG3_9FUNG|nr:hypothetical protein BGZ99_005612 [Dissophora globulifera]
MSNPQQPPVGEGAANLLDCDSVLSLLQRLLTSADTTDTTPTPAGEESTSTTESDTPAAAAPRTILGNPYEGLAALTHAMMTAVGFKLVGLGEDDSLGDRQSIEDLSKANVLPERWNASKESYSFRYTHSHSQLTYLIKCMRLAGKCVIHGTTIETSKICSLELEVKDFASPSYFPFTTATNLNTDPLWNGFISRSRINDLIAQFKLKIVQQLIPGLSKPGYQEESAPSSTTTGSGSTSGTGAGRRADPGYYPDDPLRFPGVGGIPQPGRPGFVPRPPIFGDPFSAEDPEFMGNPFEIGRSDLDPFGGRIGGGFGGIGGLGGIGSGGIGGSSGGGMYVGPNHPMFRRPPGGIGGSGGSGIYGGPQPLPRGSVPPGARFDPIGPFGPSGGSAPGAGTAHRDPHQWPASGQGRGAGRGVPFSGEPDNDDAPPPGYMDMFM